jgi:hypothetical protein
MSDEDNSSRERMYVGVNLVGGFLGGKVMAWVA